MNRLYRRPSLAALRQAELQSDDARIGNWLARYFARPTAVYGTWLATRLGLSAHSVTLASLLTALFGVLLIGTGSPLGFLLGVYCQFLAFWLDRVDGQIARWTNTTSLSGVYFDYLMHHLVTLCLGFGLGYGLAVETGALYWNAAGAAAAIGWATLSFHHDTRYKAFFQPLKRATGAFLVKGGAGGRPTLPSPWPRQGLRRFTWPAYKSCEQHMVLTALGLIAVVGSVAPTTGVWLKALYLATMAVIAPILAMARISRAIRVCSAEEEFAAWFVPVVDESRLRQDGQHTHFVTKAQHNDADHPRTPATDATQS